VVLLIYSNEDSYHLDVVRCFAKFLEMNANCQVLYCQPNGIDSNDYQYLLKWVHQQLQRSEYVIVIHSKASAQFMVTTSPTAAVLDTFQALHAIYCEQRHSSPSTRYQLINVSFPCCQSNNVTNFFSGKAFQLMEEITDLVNLIGKSSGTTCPAPLTGNDASVIGESCSYGIELLALKQAIVVCQQASEDSRSLNSYDSELTYCGGANGNNVTRCCERQRCCPSGCLPILHFIPPDDGIRSETGTENFEAKIREYNRQYDASI